MSGCKSGIVGQITRLSFLHGMELYRFLKNVFILESPADTELDVNNQ